MEGTKEVSRAEMEKGKGQRGVQPKSILAIFIFISALVFVFSYNFELLAAASAQASDEWHMYFLGPKWDKPILLLAALALFYYLTSSE